MIVSRTFTVSILLSVLLLIAGCAGVPDIQYYALHVEPEIVEEAPLPLTVEIVPFDIAKIYNDFRIIYQGSPFLINHYNYHQWATSPAQLVTEAFYRFFRENGTFRQVAMEGQLTHPDLRLTGRIINFGEWDENNQWHGWLNIEFAISDLRTGQVAITRRFEHKEPATRRNPEAIARALSLAVQKIGKQVIELLKKEYGPEINKQ